MKRYPFLLLVAGLLSGCVSVSVNRQESAGGSPRSGASLIEADRAFAQLAVQQGMAVALDRYSDDASVRLVPAGPVIRGTTALRADAAALSPGALTWDPQHAEVAGSGDLGWTWGDYRLTEAGRTVTGRYLTVWHKRAGAWRIAADIGTQACP